jgi:hypothetical protein
VVTGPGIISEPGSAVDLKAFPGFKRNNPAEILALPEVVFVFAGYLTGFAGNTPAQVKIKSQSHFLFPVHFQKGGVSYYIENRS